MDVIPISETEARTRVRAGSLGAGGREVLGLILTVTGACCQCYVVIRAGSEAANYSEHGDHGKRDACRDC